MGEAGRKRLDHVVLPRRLPGLALLERFFPSPADNQLGLAVVVVPIIVASLDNTVRVGPQPPSTAPTTFSAGIRTSVRKTSVKCA